MILFIIQTVSLVRVEKKWLFNHYTSVFKNLNPSLVQKRENKLEWSEKKCLGLAFFITQKITKRQPLFVRCVLHCLDSWYYYRYLIFIFNYYYVYYYHTYYFSILITKVRILKNPACSKISIFYHIVN